MSVQRARVMRWLLVCSASRLASSALRCAALPSAMRVHATANEGGTRNDKHTQREQERTTTTEAEQLHVRDAFLRRFCLAIQKDARVQET